MSNEINDGGAAFPRPAVFTEVHGLASPEQAGMTMRDYFAAKAMQGRMAGSYPWSDLGFRPISGLTPIQNEAVLAYQVADAMLAARAKQQAADPVREAAQELLAALQAISPFIPKTSAAEGGAATHSAAVRAADLVRAAIFKATGKAGGEA